MSAVCITKGCKKECRSGAFLHCWDHTLNKCEEKECSEIVEDNNACSNHKCSECHRLARYKDKKCDFHTSLRCKICKKESVVSNLCEEHLCKSSGCTNTRFIYVLDGMFYMLRYCIRCRCKYQYDDSAEKRCNKKSLDGSDFCGKHSCQVLSCSNPRTPTVCKCDYHQCIQL
jgi:hypothetical protein